MVLNENTHNSVRVARAVPQNLQPVFAKDQSQVVFSVEGGRFILIEKDRRREDSWTFELSWRKQITRFHAQFGMRPTEDGVM